MESVWRKTAEAPEFGALEGDLRTDVLIVGGGIAGILCARMLTDAGADCAVAETGRICGGITGNTTAKLTLQHGLIYDRLMGTYGEDTAQGYLEANRTALERYREMCRGIDCELEERDSFVYSADDRQKIEDELSALDRLGCPAEFAGELPLPFPVAGAVRIRGQAQFHPLKFAYAAAKGLRIYENTKITELMPGCAVTNNGRIKAKAIIVATHFPILNKHGGYFLKMYQHRSYVLAVRNAPDVGGMYVDEAKTGMSFRNYGDMLLIGGGGHRTGKKGGGWWGLDAFARRFYPDCAEEFRWATQDCMTLDGIPYIGRYSGGTEGLYVATGFNKWGMTSAMAAAMILCDTVMGRTNPYAEVFSTSRSVLHPQLAVNTAEALLGLLTPAVPRCPHMGCALKYNPHEHSWDCSCHGSRFTKSGELIDGPATDDKRIDN